MKYLISSIAVAILPWVTISETHADDASDYSGGYSYVYLYEREGASAPPVMELFHETHPKPQPDAPTDLSAFAACHFELGPCRGVAWHGAADLLTSSYYLDGRGNVLVVVPNTTLFEADAVARKQFMDAYDTGFRSGFRGVMKILIPGRSHLAGQLEGWALGQWTGYRAYQRSKFSLHLLESSLELNTSVNLQH